MSLDRHKVSRSPEEGVPGRAWIFDAAAILK